MKLTLAALITCDIEDLMLAADRPQLHHVWRVTLAKLREGNPGRIGARFRPRQSDSDWCIGNAILWNRMYKAVQLSWHVRKEEFFLLKLRGSLEPLEKHNLLCKIDDALWDLSNPQTEPWGGFGFEGTYYIGEKNPWPNLIGDII